MNENVRKIGKRNKKLSYLRGTARRTMLVLILSTAAQLFTPNEMLDTI